VVSMRKQMAKRRAKEEELIARTLARGRLLGRHYILKAPGLISHAFQKVLVSLYHRRKNLFFFICNGESRAVRRPAHTCGKLCKCITRLARRVSI
jgi:hypothetical protein